MRHYAVYRYLPDSIGVITEISNVNADEPYSFRMERTTYKSQDLIYEEPGHKLVANVEMSGVRRYDWVATDTEFQKWTEPAGEPIPKTKQRQILERLAEWGRREKVRFGIGPPVDMEAEHEKMHRKGWTVEHLSDGTVRLSPPLFPVWRLAIQAAVFGCLMAVGGILGSTSHPFLAGIAYCIGGIGQLILLLRLSGWRGFEAILVFLLVWLIAAMVFSGA